MKKILLGLSTVALLSACTSFKPDYIVQDASRTSAPKWITNAYKAADSSKEKKEFRFYNADSENVNKRLCQKSAETRATQKIASEVAQEIMGMFQEKNSATDDTATAKLKDVLEQNIKTSLHGVQITDQYWEKRAYRMEMGAPQDIVKYKCDAVVKIKVSSLEEALNAYKAKTIKTLSADQKVAMEQAVDEYKDSLKQEKQE